MKYFLCFILFFSLHTLMAQTPIIPFSNNKIIVIAHRGDHSIAPENSLQSIKNAIAIGVDYVELDLRTTKDGQLVFMHDQTVDRTTNGHGKIKDILYDSLRLLKLYNKQVQASDTFQIPNIDEVLLLCKNKINIYLDFKDADVQKTYNAIIAANMQNQFVVYINSPNQYIAWRNIAPNLPLILSLNTKIQDSADMIKYLKSVPLNILDGSWEEYNKQTVTAAQSFGVPIWADMQSQFEDEKYWEKGLALNFQGIQTDHPKALIEYLVKINKR